MQCRSCGTDNREGRKFCSQCASSLSPEILCPDCGAANEPSDKFCGECAGALVVVSAAPTPRQRTAAPEQPAAFAHGRYEVKDFLGEGGKKRVYRAHDSVLDRDVALAVIKTEGLDPTSRVRITREAQAMGRLGDHPHVLSIHDLGEDNGQPYMVLPLMPGGDVEALLETAEDHRLPLAQTIDLAAQICRGLEFAHSKEIVHRDLKPGNVWLTSDGTAKIGDFGLAVAIDRSRLTQEGMMVGTVSYMPPEQAMGGDVTPQSDLYSLGAMLYEMVTGRPPFLGDDSVAIIGQHINTPPVAPTWHNSECPRALEALILRLLTKDPSERPASASDVLTALEGIDLTVSTDEPAPERDEAQVLDSLAGGVFVGRHAEMGELKACLEDALSGRGRMVTLIGEPGIGKTRTAQELATYAGLRGCQVLWGRCYEEQGVPPYWPWVQAIRGYVRGRDPEQLRSEMGAGAADIAEIVSDVKTQLPELEPPPQLDSPEQARFRLFDSITAFLRTAGQKQPLVLVLDDLHWSDKPSLMLLQFVTRELPGARVLLVGTYRDVELNRQHPLAETLAELTRERLFERVILRGLNREDVGRFIEATSGISPPAGLVSAVHTQTEGNPLFVTEVVRLLVQEGELTPGRTGDRQSWTVRIPEGVREVIGRRLNRMSQRCNETLTVASVIGREFELKQLDLIIDDLNQDMLLDVLEEALAARLIEELPDAIGRYQFTHALIQETLSEELSLTRRVRLHARIAEMLEQLWADDIESHASELAHHFVQAEAMLGSDKLVRYAAMAGERALDDYAFEEAMVFLGNAFAAVDDKTDDERTADILFGLGRAQVATWESSEFSTALGTFIRAFDIYASVGATDKATAVAESYFETAPGLLADAAPMVERALKLVPEGSLLEGRLQSRYGHVLGREVFDLENAQIALDRALELAKKHDDPRLEMNTLRSAATVHNIHANWQACIDYDMQAIQLAGAADDRYTEIRTHHGLGLAFAGIGEPEKAREHFESAMLLASEVRNNALQNDSLSGHGALLVNMGAWETARDLLQRCHSDRRAMLSRAVLAYHLGEFDEASAVISELIESRGMFGARRAPQSLLIIALGTASYVSNDASYIERATEIFEDFSSDRVPPIARFHAEGGMAMISVISKDQESASRQYKTLKDSQGRIERHVQVDRVLGLLANTMGKLDDAQTHFDDALTFCRKAGYRPELAWSLCDYADMLLERDEEGDRQKATTLLDESLAVSSELGMRPLMERVLSRKMSLQGIDISLPETSIEAVVSAVEVERPNLQPHAAPDGTVTVMFTDVEGSTAMTERLGDVEAQEVLRVHNVIIRQQVTAYQGFEVKSQGDGFMVAFSSARRGLECAIAIQQTFATHKEAHPGEPIRVRIGLHTGEAIKEGEDFFGKTVILAARIACEASGGQILVSSLLKALVESSGEFQFRDELDVELKGLSGTHKVFLVGWYGAGGEDRHNEE